MTNKNDDLLRDLDGTQIADYGGAHAKLHARAAARIRELEAQAAALREALEHIADPGPWGGLNAFDQIKALQAEALAALAETAPLMDWLSIDTAPNDGSPVLIWSAGKTPVVAYASQAGMGWRSVPGDRRYTPTHWLPIPTLRYG